MKIITVSVLVLCTAVWAAASQAGSGTAQLPPEIRLDRHLVRAERLLADGNPAAALAALDDAVALQEEHDLVLPDGFAFEYAQVAYDAARTDTAIAWLNRYLQAVGREGEFYREALPLLDSAEVRLEREEAERRRRQAERRRLEAERRRQAEREAERRRVAEARRLGPAVVWIGGNLTEYRDRLTSRCPVRFVGQASDANLIVLGWPSRELHLYDAAGERVVVARRDWSERICETMARLSDRQLTQTLGEPRDSTVFMLFDGDLKPEHGRDFTGRCPGVRLPETLPRQSSL